MVFETIIKNATAHTVAFFCAFFSCYWSVFLAYRHKSHRPLYGFSFLDKHFQLVLHEPYDLNSCSESFPGLSGRIDSLD